MNLSKEYKMVLKHFNTINKNMYFVKGNQQTTIIGTNAGPVLFVRYTAVEEMPDSFAVADLGSLITILDIFSEFDLNITNKKLLISNGKKNVNLTLTKKEFIQHEANPGRFNAPSVGESFNVDESTFDEIFKLAAVLKTPHIFFEGKDDKLFIGTEDCENPTTDSSKFELGSSQRNFKYVLEKDNLRVMKGGYKLTIPEKKFIYFDNEKSDHRLEYFLPVNSKHSR